RAGVDVVAADRVDEHDPVGNLVGRAERDRALVVGSLRLRVRLEEIERRVRQGILVEIGLTLLYRLVGRLVGRVVAVDRAVDPRQTAPDGRIARRDGVPRGIRDPRRPRPVFAVQRAARCGVVTRQWAGVDGGRAADLDVAAHADGARHRGDGRKVYQGDVD